MDGKCVNYCNHSDHKHFSVHFSQSKTNKIQKHFMKQAKNLSITSLPILNNNSLYTNERNLICNMIS